ncbi:MAG TPA: hypothetical protein VER14_02310, partial [Phototrophicaceae bacterium]|nr:hypothetical protein [Phototrophicaceae bacterium]
MSILGPHTVYINQNPSGTKFFGCKANAAYVKAFIVPYFHFDTMTTKIFLNLPVKDLNKAIEFFTKLEFGFDPQFTDENATCMLVGEDTFVML